MAKNKMTDDEINEYIKSKQVSSDQYVAPTVKVGSAPKKTTTNSNRAEAVQQTVTMPTLNKNNQKTDDKIALFNNANQNIQNQQVNELNEKNKNSGLFKGGSSNFLEGYANTMWDTGLNIGKGFFQTLEGLADFLQYKASDSQKMGSQALEKVFGKNAISDFYSGTSNWLKENAKFDSTGSLFGTNENAQDTLFGNQWRNDINEKSYLGDMGDSIGEGIGNIGAMAALSAVGGEVLGATGIGTTATGSLTTGGKLLLSGGSSYTSAYGNARSEAYKNGATDEEASKYAFVNGLSEAISEQFFDAMPGIKSVGVADKLGIKDFLGKKIQSGIGSNTAKIFMRLAGGFEEGAEEMISNALTTMGNDLMHMVDESYTYGMENNSGNPIEDGWNALFSEDSLKSFMSAGFTSAILGFGGDVLTSAQQTQLINAYAKDNGITYKEAKAQIEAMKQQQEVQKQEQVQENTQNSENTVQNEEKSAPITQPTVETETPNIETNPQNNINTQTNLEQTQLDLEDTNNEVLENKEQNDNLAERKNEDVLKVTNKQTAKNVATKLNDAIKGNDNTEDFQTMKRNIEKETGKKMRSWVETSTKSTGNTELVNSMNKEKITYEPTSNKKNLDSANRELAGLTYEQKVEKAKALLKSDKRLKSTDVALLETVIQEAQKEGKVDDFIELVQDTAILGTETGQVVQALSLIKQSDPMTQIDTLRKLIEREQAKGNKVYQGVEIKPQLVENVLNSYNEDGSWNQENFDNAMDELKQDIADQMHVRPTEKLNAWRYLSMLGNPKTHIRNVVANIAMGGLQKGKNKLAAGIEAITPMNKLNKLLGGSEEATRGKTLKRSSQEIKSYANETIDAYFKEHQAKSKYNETMGNLKGDLESRREIFSDKTLAGKMLNKLEKANSKALDIEDVVFNKKTTKQAFENFLTASGLETRQDIENNPEIVAQALEYATFKGNEATFHQHSQTGTALRNFRESLRQGSNLTRIVGLGMDATLPFINTPINIAKTGIEYTPGLGMIKTISDVNSAPMNMKADVLIDSISKQFVGGMLAAAGYFLANSGILNGKGGNDKDEKLEKNLGKQDYSINIGGNTYDLSWLSPSAMPLFVGVELYNTLKDNKEVSPEMVMNILASTIDPLSEMSVISSVTEAMQSYSKGTQALQDIATSAFTSYISQYFPTLMGQVATLFDDTQRSSSGKTVSEKLINQVKYKIPGLRNTLPEQVNVWGDDKKLADNPIQKAFEAFLSPSNRKELKVDDTTKEIERIYDNTGSGLPSLSLTQSPKIDSEYVGLTTEEYTKYKKDYGKTSKELLDELVELDDYKTATDEEKKKMISAIYDYSTYIARKNIADDKNIKYEYKQSDGTGYNYPKYYLSLSKEDFAEYVAKKYNEEDE